MEHGRMWTIEDTRLLEMWKTKELHLEPSGSLCFMCAGWLSGSLCSLSRRQRRIVVTSREV
jgi:hypothetical protein